MSFAPPPPGDLEDPLGRSGLDLSDLVIAVFSTVLCVTLAFLGLVPLYNRVTGADAATAKPAHAAAQAKPETREHSRPGRPRELFPDEPAAEDAAAPPQVAEAAEAVASSAPTAQAEEGAAEERTAEEGATMGREAGEVLEAEEEAADAAAVSTPEHEAREHEARERGARERIVAAASTPDAERGA